MYKSSLYVFLIYSTDTFHSNTVISYYISDIETEIHKLFDYSCEKNVYFLLFNKIIIYEFIPKQLVNYLFFLFVKVVLSRGILEVY